MRKTFLISMFCLTKFFVFGQIDSATMANLSKLSPVQKQLLIKQNSSIQPTGATLPTASIPNRKILVDQPSPDSFTDRSEFLGELAEMENIVLNDISNLELELENEKNSDDNELLAAIEESRSLLRKIKELQRREIEKRAEEFVKTETDAIKPFGYDLFASDSSTFAPGNEVPVPTDYRIGPGDMLEVQLFGQQNKSFSLIISREGLIKFPGIGPINAFENGTSFIELKNHLKEKIQEHLGEGVQGSIALGAFRSIRIFLLGEVRSQGAYTVSSLSTLVNALLVGGGIKETGSLRKVHLKRNGKIITTIDLYDLLLAGDTSSDSSLQSGDVIFVPVVEKQISISGTVRRPAKYEVLGGETLKDAIDLAGGTIDRAYLRVIRLERLGADFRPRVKNLNIPDDLSFKLIAGDVISLGSSGVKVTNSVTLIGNVDRPGEYEWKKGITIKDLVQGQEDLLPRTDLKYGFIRRKNDDGTIKIIDFSPSDLLGKKDSNELLSLEKHDVVYFLPSDLPRTKFLAEILSDLRKQSSPGSSPPIVEITGFVRYPGLYPLTSGMDLQKLLDASGGLLDSSYTMSAELTKFMINSDENVTVEHFQVFDLSRNEQDGSKKVYLQPYDHLIIKKKPFWKEASMIELGGQFIFPGKYQIHKGESLNDVIMRAGGLSQDAFLAGAIFTREHIRKKETIQRNDFINRLENLIAYKNLEEARNEDGSSEQSRAMLARLKSIESTGRLVIDLETVLSSNNNKIVCLDGDKLFVPERLKEITVGGEVRFPSSHLHDSSFTLMDYIDRSGGLTERSEKDRISIVKSNGMVVTNNSNKWFKSQKAFLIEPGDMIVVPVKVRLPSKFLENLSLSTQVIYQMAVAAAAVNSF